MKRLFLIALMAGGLAFVPAQRSDAQVSVGVGVGYPGYRYSYYGYPGYGNGYYPYRYYRPYRYSGYYNGRYLLQQAPLLPPPSVPQLLSLLI